MEAAKKILPGLKWKNQRLKHGSFRSEGIIANFPIPGGKQVFVYRVSDWNLTPNQIYSSTSMPPGLTNELEALRLVKADLEAKAKMLRDALDTIAEGDDKTRIERDGHAYIFIRDTHFQLTRGRTHIWCTHGAWEARLCYDSNGKLTHEMITDRTYGSGGGAREPLPMDDPHRRRDIGSYTLTPIDNYADFAAQQIKGPQP